jgi:hypothetical protein
MLKRPRHPPQRRVRIFYALSNTLLFSHQKDQPSNASALDDRSCAPGVCSLSGSSHHRRAVSTFVNNALNANSTSDVNAGFGVRRSFTTVQDPPVRHYDGLKDQNQTFPDIYSPSRPRYEEGYGMSFILLSFHVFWLVTPNLIP